jgi:hypothetical protein
MTNKTLSQVLALDAATCAAVFALGVFASAFVAGLTGLPEPILTAGGWICLAAAALLAFLAARPSRALLWLAIVGNAGWVAASLAVYAVFVEALTPIGHAVVLAQAAGVALFTALELRGVGAVQARPAIV